MSISKKLFGAFFSLILITMSLGVYAVWSISHIGNIALDIYDKGLMSVNFAQSAALDIGRVQALLAESGLVGNKSEVSVSAVPIGMSGSDRRVSVATGPSGIVSADQIVTGSVAGVAGADDVSGASPSERQRLIAFAGVSAEPSERQRLIAIARLQSGEPAARAESVHTASA